MIALIINKINKQTGESLVESLVAVLISALAMLLLATAISTASTMILDTEKKYEEYYSANLSLTKLNGTSVEIDYPKLTVGSTSSSTSIDYYGSSKLKVYVNNKLSGIRVVAY